MTRCVWEIVALNSLRPFSLRAGMAGTECQILIIGCGISGVAAAQRLIEAGFQQVRILEATGRSGGRILTESLGER